MSMSKAWKQAERRIARFLGGLTAEEACLRTPLSGGNGRISRSDTDHSRLFIEAKQRQDHSAWTVFDGVRPLARKEEKIPVVALFRKRSPGALICIHSDHLAEFCRLLYESEKLVAEKKQARRRKKKALLT
jgi:hypothetical protein